MADHDPEKDEQRRAHPAVIGKRVHRLEHARAGEESPEDGQAERGQEKGEVPDPQHGPSLLDHGRMQEGGRGQPGQQGGVFDRDPMTNSRPSPSTW